MIFVSKLFDIWYMLWDMGKIFSWIECLEIEFLVVMMIVLVIDIVLFSLVWFKVNGGKYDIDFDLYRSLIWCYN